MQKIPCLVWELNMLCFSYIKILVNKQTCSFFHFARQFCTIVTKRFQFHCSLSPPVTLPQMALTYAHQKTDDFLCYFQNSMSLFEKCDTCHVLAILSAMFMIFTYSFRWTFILFEQFSHILAYFLHCSYLQNEELYFLEAVILVYKKLIQSFSCPVFQVVPFSLFTT